MDTRGGVPFLRRFEFNGRVNFGPVFDVARLRAHRYLRPGSQTHSQITNVLRSIFHDRISVLNTRQGRYTLDILAESDHRGARTLFFDFTRSGLLILSLNRVQRRFCLIPKYHLRNGTQSYPSF